MCNCSALRPDRLERDSLSGRCSSSVALHRPVTVPVTDSAAGTHSFAPSSSLRGDSYNPIPLPVPEPLLLFIPSHHARNLLLQFCSCTHAEHSTPILQFANDVATPTAVLVRRKLLVRSLAAPRSSQSFTHRNIRGTNRYKKPCARDGGGQCSSLMLYYCAAAVRAVFPAGL